MKISDLLADKGDAVEVIDAAATIAEAVRRLALHSIGALVVSNDTRSVDGILSERDVVRLLARDGDEALHRIVADAMTTPVSTCRPSAEAVYASVG